MSKIKVLVVEDDPNLGMLLSEYLTAKGFDTHLCNNGQAGYDAFKNQSFDILLLDVMMPKMDGFEVVRRIKANTDLPFVPVIMQTALDSTQDIVEGLNAGADDYITKPLNFAELEARVKSLLRIKALQESLEERERQLEEINEKLQRMSMTDGLTGIANRRALEERLRDMFEHSLRLHEPLSIVMCDIDRFKSVNDTYGHQAGDDVLKQFAQVLHKEAREIDKVGRYGGEEFMLLLPGTVLDAAVTFAERVRHSIESHTFEFDGGTLKRTMSCGVAAWPHPKIQHTDGLIKAADDALYIAKKTGRNRVIRFDSNEFNANTEEQSGEARRPEPKGEAA